MAFKNMTIHLNLEDIQQALLEFVRREYKAETECRVLGPAFLVYGSDGRIKGADFAVSGKE